MTRRANTLDESLGGPFIRRITRSLSAEILGQIIYSDINLFIIQLSSVADHLHDELLPFVVARFAAEHWVQAVTGPATILEQLFTFSFGELLLGETQSRNGRKQGRLKP